MRKGSLSAVVLALGLLAGPPAIGQMAFPNEPNARASAPPSQPAEESDHECFDRQEQRMAVNQGLAIRLGAALRSINARDGDELLRAELCRNKTGLVYVLTILATNGKVSRTVIDARSGAVIKDR